MPLLALLLLLASLAPSPTLATGGWLPQTSGTTASLRGLSVVSPRVAWASGSNGTYLVTTDGGAHWMPGHVAGTARLDFRDVKAFGDRVAYLLAIAAQGGIFKTTDGGTHWSEQYSNSAPGFFLDGLAFWDADHGLALGDPMDGKFLLLRTSDGGRHWRPATTMPAALTGEGAFAASGTSLVVGARHQAWFATGGTAGARVFHSSDGGATWAAMQTPMAAAGRAASAGAGIFSLAFRDARHGIAVGGDYALPAATARTAALTQDGGLSWQLAAGPLPSGYRSAVAYRPHSGGRELIAVGPNGADLSRDGGGSWSRLSAMGFNSVAFASDGTAWAVGGHGTIARWRGPL